MKKMRLENKNRDNTDELGNEGIIGKINAVRFWQLTLSGLATLTGWRTLRSN